MRTALEYMMIKEGVSDLGMAPCHDLACDPQDDFSDDPAEKEGYADYRCDIDYFLDMFVMAQSDVVEHISDGGEKPSGHLM